jgi:hypothetical protein
MGLKGLNWKISFSGVKMIALHYECVPLTEIKCFGEVCMLNPLFKKTCCARNMNAILHILFKQSE